MTQHPVPYRDDGAPRIEQLARVTLRPMATPLPLGFLVLGIGSCLVSALQLGWIPIASSHQVAAAVLTVVVAPELIAAIFAFLIRDVVMATSFGLLTGSWTAVGVLLRSCLHLRKRIRPRTTSAC